jgi:hypothetical protein
MPINVKLRLDLKKFMMLVPIVIVNLGDESVNRLRIHSVTLV